MILVGFGLYGLYSSSTPYICSKNPDKCVCEEFKVFTTAYGYKPIFVKTEQEARTLQIGSAYNPPPINYECMKFRKKTQAEQDADSCNSNPREDDLCKCEETKDNLDKPIRGYACTNSCKEISCWCLFH